MALLALVRDVILVALVAEVVLLPCWSPVLCWSVLEDRLWEPVLPSRPVRSRSSERARILSTLEREVNLSRF